MKNFLNPSDYQALQQRIIKLRADSPAQWGKMNSNEMICHIGDQLRMALGGIKTVDQGNFFTRNVAKYLVLWGVPAPRGKIKTAKEIDQNLKAGTPPVNFERDRQDLLTLMMEFRNISETYDFQPHPAFGKMSKKQWGRMAYTHMQHHLTQFGV